MNEHVKKWVAALRSNTYKQGHGQLREGDSFCCLGVACDLVDPAGWELADAIYPLPIYEHRGKWVFPPTDVSETYQLTRALEDHVATMNDNGATFEQIADYIESIYVEA